MKRIGLIGGTSWPSTMEYYRLLNEQAAQKLGAHHSANLLLYSIDYHDIKSRYASRWNEIPALLKKEFDTILSLPCDGLILCNNTLHKAYDNIAPGLKLTIPFFHAVDLTARYALRHTLKRVLLLATKFTMEDGFFQRKLEACGMEVTIPASHERERIQAIQTELAGGVKRPEFTRFFHSMLKNYAGLDAVILACTELPLAIPSKDVSLRIINPIELQCQAAMEFACGSSVFNESFSL